MIMSGHIRHGNFKASSVDRRRSELERRMHRLDERISSMTGNNRILAEADQFIVKEQLAKPTATQHKILNPSLWYSREEEPQLVLKSRPAVSFEPHYIKQPIEFVPPARPPSSEPNNDVSKLFDLVKTTLQSQNQIQNELRELRKEFKMAMSYNSQFGASFARGNSCQDNKLSYCDNSSCIQYGKYQQKDRPPLDEVDHASSLLSDFAVKDIRIPGKENIPEMDSTVKFSGHKQGERWTRQSRPLTTIDKNIQVEQKRTYHTNVARHPAPSDEIIEITGISEPSAYDRGVSANKKPSPKSLLFEPSIMDRTLNRTLKAYESSEQHRGSEQVSMANSPQKPSRQHIKDQLLQSNAILKIEVQQRLAEARELYRDSEHKNARYQHHHIINTFDLQKKLRDELLKRVYVMQDGKRYK